jgi:transcriptional regulator with XRE-family HTH domain
MSDADGREAGGQVVSDNAAREFEWAELQQHLLREEVQRKKEFRDIFEAHEKVIAEKVRQLRTERGWSQDDLARRMDELGWPMHQTTVAKLEAAKRPIRAAEVYALAMAFGLPMQALWYLPLPGEPWPLERMRDEFRRVDDRIASTMDTILKIAAIYADQQTERIRLARAIDLAAQGSPVDVTGQPDTNPDLLREMAGTLAQRDGSARRLAARGATEADVSAHAKAEEDPQLAEFAARVRERYEAGESPESIARWLREFLPSGMSSALDVAAVGAVMNPARLASIIASVKNIDRAQANPPADPESRG